MARRAVNLAMSYMGLQAACAAVQQGMLGTRIQGDKAPLAALAPKRT